MNYIFLISQPGAGSTMLQKLLAEHHDIYSFQEGWLALDLLTLNRKDGIQTFYNRDIFHRYVGDIVQEVGEGQLNKSIKCFFDTFYKEVGEKGGYKFILDKTPRYFLVIDRLKQVFPDAKFIFLIRNPLSIFMSKLRGGALSLTQFASENHLDLITAIENFHKHKEENSPNDLFIKYEDLLDDHESHLTNIQNFLGLKDIIKISNYQSKNTGSNYGDGSGNVNRFSSPEKKLADKWKLEVNPVKASYLMTYLEIIGKKKFERLGYNFEQNVDFLRSKINFNSHIKLPFRTLVNDSSQSSVLRKVFIRVLRTVF